MKKIILAFTFVHLVVVSVAQTFQLAGKVLENNNNPVEFAEILLIRNDSVFQYELTDENGHFLMNAAQGIYVLYIKQLGDTLHRQSVNINRNVELNIITEKKAKELQEVTITAQKKLVERKADRMVFNVTNLPNTDGGDVIEILKITPSLIVNNNQISIAGKGAVNVLLNDRFVQLSGEELTSFLKSLRANDVEKIEIITTPPAKYEAESFGGNFNYRKNKLAFFAGASYSGGKSNNDDEAAIFYPELKWESKGNYTYRSNSISTRAGFDVNMADNWTLGVQYMGSFSKPKSTNGDKTAISDRFTDADRGNILTEGKGNSKSNTQSANVHSIITLDTLGRKINVDFDILNYHSNSDRTYASNTTGSQTVEIPNDFISQNNLLDRKITNYSAQIDIEHPLTLSVLWASVAFAQTAKQVKKYDYADEGCSCSRIRVRAGNKWGFIDENGKKIIPLKYDDAEMFHNCRALVTLKGEKFYIDMDGKKNLISQF